jgi:hypothetical protein
MGIFSFEEFIWRNKVARLWNAFIQDYRDEIFDWSIRTLLELFWYYCQDGNRAVYKRLNESLRDVENKYLEG